MNRQSSNAPYWQPGLSESILTTFLVLALGLTITLSITVYGIKYSFLSPFFNGLANTFAIGFLVLFVGLWIQDGPCLYIPCVSLATATAAGLGASVNAAALNPTRLLANFSVEIFTRDVLGTATGLVLLWMVWRHIRE